MSCCGSCSSNKTGGSTTLLAWARIGVVGLLLTAPWAGFGASTSSVAREATPLRLLLLPPDNESGKPTGFEDLRALLEHALQTEGFEVLTGQKIEPFLAAHRFRYTGGVSREFAAAAREDLKVDAVLVTSILARDPSATVPQVAVALRLVSVEPLPRILWARSLGVAADENPGPFDLGIFDNDAQLMPTVVDRLVADLRIAVQGEDEEECPSERRFRPSTHYWDRRFQTDARRRVLSVLPFVNLTPHEDAGNMLALSLLHQVVRMDRFSVVEPGVTRDALLEQRVQMPRGVSLEQARGLRGALAADLVLTGTIFEYETQPPKATFTASILDLATERVVWQVSTHHAGDDGVFFFDQGQIKNGPKLVCYMAAAALEGFEPRDNRRPPLGSDFLGIQWAGLPNATAQELGGALEGRIQDGLSRVTGRARWQWSTWGWLSVSGEVPVTFFDDNGSAGLGRIRVAPKLRLFSDDAFDLAIVARVDLPTELPHPPFSSATLSPALLLSRWGTPLRVAADLSGSVRELFRTHEPDLFVVMGGALALDDRPRPTEFQAALATAWRSIDGKLGEVEARTGLGFGYSAETDVRVGVSYAAPVDGSWWRARAFLELDFGRETRSRQILPFEHLRRSHEDALP